MCAGTCSRCSEIRGCSTRRTREAVILPYATCLGHVRPSRAVNAARRAVGAPRPVHVLSGGARSTTRGTRLGRVRTRGAPVASGLLVLSSGGFAVCTTRAMCATLLRRNTRIYSKTAHRASDTGVDRGRPRKTGICTYWAGRTICNFHIQSIRICARIAPICPRVTWCAHGCIPLAHRRVWCQRVYCSECASAACAIRASFVRKRSTRTGCAICQDDVGRPGYVAKRACPWNFIRAGRASRAATQIVSSGVLH